MAKTIKGRKTPEVSAKEIDEDIFHSTQRLRKKRASKVTVKPTQKKRDAKPAPATNTSATRPAVTPTPTPVAPPLDRNAAQTERIIRAALEADKGYKELLAEIETAWSKVPVQPARLKALLAKKEQYSKTFQYGYHHLQWHTDPHKRDMGKKMSHFIEDYIPHGDKDGGTPRETGFYTGTYRTPYWINGKKTDQLLLFKQDIPAKDISEFVAGSILHAIFTDDSIATVFLGRSPDVTREQALQPDETGKSVYLGSVYFGYPERQYNDLYKDQEVVDQYHRQNKTAPTARPRYIGLDPVATNALVNAMLDENKQEKFTGFQRGAAGSLFVGDFDLHSGNWGTIPEKIPCDLIYLDVDGDTPINFNQLPGSSPKAAYAITRDVNTRERKILFLDKVGKITHRIAISPEDLNGLMRDLNLGHQTVSTCLIANLSNQQLKTITTHTHKITPAITNPRKKKLVRIDFGASLDGLDDDIRSGSQMRHLPIKFKKGWFNITTQPTNHYSEFPTELKVKEDFAWELSQVADFPAKDLKASIDKSIDEAQRAFGVKPMFDFAEYIGVDVTAYENLDWNDLISKPENQALRENIKARIVADSKAFLFQKMSRRQESIRRLQYDIELSLAIWRDKKGEYHLRPELIKELIFRNPVYFLTGRYHFRKDEHHYNFGPLRFARDHKKLTNLIDQEVYKYFPDIINKAVATGDARAMEYFMANPRIMAANQAFLRRQREGTHTDLRNLKSTYEKTLQKAYEHFDELFVQIYDARDTELRELPEILSHKERRSRSIAPAEAEISLLVMRDIISETSDAQRKLVIQRWLEIAKIAHNNENKFLEIAIRKALQINAERFTKDILTPADRMDNIRLHITDYQILDEKKTVLMLAREFHKSIQEPDPSSSLSSYEIYSNLKIKKDRLHETEPLSATYRAMEKVFQDPTFYRFHVTYTILSKKHVEERFVLKNAYQHEINTQLALEAADPLRIRSRETDEIIRGFKLANELLTPQQKAEDLIFEFRTRITHMIEILDQMKVQAVRVVKPQPDSSQAELPNPTDQPHTLQAGEKEAFDKARALDKQTRRANPPEGGIQMEEDDSTPWATLPAQEETAPESARVSEITEEDFQAELKSWEIIPRQAETAPEPVGPTIPSDSQVITPTTVEPEAVTIEAEDIPNLTDLTDANLIELGNTEMMSVPTPPVATTSPTESALERAPSQINQEQQAISQTIADIQAEFDSLHAPLATPSLDPAEHAEPLDAPVDETNDAALSDTEHSSSATSSTGSSLQGHEAAQEDIVEENEPLAASTQNVSSNNVSEREQNLEEKRRARKARQTAMAEQREAAKLKAEAERKIREAERVAARIKRTRTSNTPTITPSSESLPPESPGFWSSLSSSLSSMSSIFTRAKTRAPSNTEPQSKPSKGPHRGGGDST